MTTEANVEIEVENDAIQVAEADTLVRMQEGASGNDEDCAIAEKW